VAILWQMRARESVAWEAEQQRPRR